MIRDITMSGKPKLSRKSSKNGEGVQTPTDAIQTASDGTGKGNGSALTRNLDERARTSRTEDTTHLSSDGFSDALLADLKAKVDQLMSEREKDKTHIEQLE
eukprot:Colp12_sorted_trinity150504_noHs@28493